MQDDNARDRADFIRRNSERDRLNSGRSDSTVSSIPKDIANAIWGACFDYQNTEEVVNGKTIEERILDCWDKIKQVTNQ
jgi:hypothetical protein